MTVSALQLRAFVGVIDAGGFAAAADELGLTQSAVSHAIASLERELGSPVLTRRPTLSPTELGKRILPHARSAVTSVHAVETIATEHREVERGVVRIAVARTVMFGLVPQLHTLWKDVLPNLDLRLFEGDDPELETWLEAGHVDAAILINPGKMHPEAVHLADDEYAAVLRSDHALAGQSQVSPAELLGDPMVVSDSGCRPYVQRIMRSVDPQFKPVSHVKDAGALFGMVASGVGICLLPSIGKSMLPAGLVMVPLHPTERRSLVLSGPRSRSWLPGVTALVNATSSNRA